MCYLIIVSLRILTYNNNKVVLIERSTKLTNKKNLSFYVKLGVSCTAGIFLFNKILTIKSIKKERLYSNNSNFFNWKFGRVFYTVNGTGSPILLIHDLSCDSSGYEWNKIVNELSKKYTVYTIDLIGCGRSDKPNLTYTNYMYVQLISDFIKNVIKQKTGIIATGLSSSICTMVCYIEPQLIDNLILVNPTSLKELSKIPNSSNKILKKIIESPLLGTFLYNGYSSEFNIRRRFQKKIFYNKNNFSKKIAQAYCEAAHLSGTSSKYVLSSLCANFVNININHALKQINNNITIIVGEHVPDSEQIVGYYSSLNPSIEVDILPNAKYLPQLEDPQLFLSTCMIYL